MRKVTDGRGPRGMGNQSAFLFVFDLWAPCVCPVFSVFYVMQYQQPPGRAHITTYHGPLSHLSHRRCR